MIVELIAISIILTFVLGLFGASGQGLLAWWVGLTSAGLSIAFFAWLVSLFLKL